MDFSSVGFVGVSGFGEILGRSKSHKCVNPLMRKKPIRNAKCAILTLSSLIISLNRFSSVFGSVLFVKREFRGFCVGVKCCSVVKSVR